MSVQISQIFTATAENIWAFLSEAGQGCYIPAYQRPYAWDDDNVDRLVDDAVNGLNHLLHRPAAISFMGTIIAIHDVNHITVKPVFKSEVAPRVMTIIDGQQRISTSVMINIALHNLMAGLLVRLEKGDGEAFEWLREQTQLAMAELWQTFALDRTTGTPPLYRFYPRVIRAFDDVWSKRANQAQYTSPIAALIWAYITHDQDTEAKKGAFAHQVAKYDGTPDPAHAPIIDVFGYIRKELNRLTGKQWELYDFPNIQQVVANDQFMSALWSYPAADAAKIYVGEKSDDRLFAPYVQLLRALIFYKYFCTRMALTVVTTQNEDDAFDMFEALNTTGEPLTAYETFRPKIIETEGLASFENSVSHKAMKRIEAYLDAYKKADDRQKATAELLIPYALAETGEKLQKNLSDQRRYLRDSFDRLPTLDDKRSAVVSMGHLAAFMDSGWQKPIDEIPQLEGAAAFDDQTAFCFQALRALKHNITVSGIARFYDELRRADPEHKAERAQDVFGAIRSTAAFSMLWRGAKGGTENIDGIYRALMRDGDAAANIPPLAKRVGEDRGVVSLNNYRRLLKGRLLKEFADRDAWVKTAARLGVYAHSREVAKFLILTASHDTVVDALAGQEGLIVLGKSGVSPTLSGEVWRSETVFSVEHIAPQSQSPGWPDEIYEPGSDAVHRLGNLTLLPKTANSYVSNKSWPHKRLLYRYFSAETVASSEDVYAEFQPAGLMVSKSGELVLGASPFMPMCKAVARVPGDWTLDVIERRSLCLAGLAYDRLVTWLD